MRGWFLVVLFVFGVSASVQAAPKYVRLGFSDPDVTTRMTVSWNTDAAGESSVVEVGKGLAYSLTFSGAERAQPGGLGFLHEAELTGLTPDTLYHYRVGGPGAWSEDATFRTLPADPCAPVRVLFLGDGRSDGDTGSSPRWPGILEEAFSYGPSLALHTGDIVHDGDVWEQWRHHLESTAPWSSRLPIGYTLGNHDDDHVKGDGALYNEVFAHPRNAKSGTEDYYYLRFADVIIVSLSTQTFGGGATPYEEQSTWLDQVLTANPARWKFVFFHHPNFTASLDVGFADVGHPPNENGQNPLFLKVFDKHHVDLAFYGHNHFYQRFEPMRQAGDPAKGEPVDSPAQGTIHVVTGGAGAFTYVVGMALLCGLTTGSEVCNGNHHFVTLEIEGGKLTFTARQTKTQILGTSDANAAVIDSFTIVKEGGTVCLEEPEPQPEPAAEAVEPEVVGEVAGPEPVEPDVLAACTTNASCVGKVAPGACPGFAACEAGVCVWTCKAIEPDVAAADTKHPADVIPEAASTDARTEADLPIGTKPREEASDSGSSCAVGGAGAAAPSAILFILLLAVPVLARRRA